MDFKEYLLDELYAISVELGLDKKIHVAEWRSFKMPDDKNDLLFVIRYITGSYVGNIKTQPLQVFCYSELDDMTSAYMILDAFSKKHNNYQTTINGNFIKMNFETPVSMRNFIQSETGYRASVYAFGTYVECEGVDDYKKIEINLGEDDEDDLFDIPYLSASLGYGAVLNTTKLSGQALNSSIKQEAGLTLVITLMNTKNDFCDLIHDIMFGEESGNYTFRFILTKNDDTTDEINMKLESVIFPTDKTSAPTLTLNFRR